MKFSLATAFVASLASLVGAQQGVVELHGSGTTNPSKCYWHIMDLIQARTKIPTKMTYRGVGSSTGQAEFIGDVTTPDNDFGSGDIPLSDEDFSKFAPNSILHLPIVLGAISFFHSVPTGGAKLNLTPCVLAKILAREITQWDDDEIKEINSGVDLPSIPINVARRGLGSSSTASITQYLNSACPGNWPESLVGKVIDWPEDTEICEGSAGMTSCIRKTPGTIGYIDAGHGISEGLAEIELRNADNVYISVLEASEAGGILAATENAGLPSNLDGSFANVNLLNQPGENTWPIVAMSYVYVRKDITYLSNPASQGLLKAFLRALYDDEYIPICEEEFGFFRVTGDLRDKALAAIDEMIVSPGTPEFTFETGTQKRTGQGEYVISLKRQSWSDIEQDSAVKDIGALQAQIGELQGQISIMNAALTELGIEFDTIGRTTSSQGFIDGGDIDEDDDDEDNQAKIALALGATSITLWILAIIVLLAKFVLRV